MHNENEVLNIAERFFVCNVFDNPVIKQGSDYCRNYLKKEVPLLNFSSVLNVALTLHIQQNSPFKATATLSASRK